MKSIRYFIIKFFVFFRSIYLYFEEIGWKSEMSIWLNNDVKSSSTLLTWRLKKHRDKWEGGVECAYAWRVHANAHVKRRKDRQRQPHASLWYLACIEFHTIKRFVEYPLTQGTTCACQNEKTAKRHGLLYSLAPQDHFCSQQYLRFHPTNNFLLSSVPLGFPSGLWPFRSAW